MNYVNGCCINEEMLRFHAEKHDNCVFGSIVLYALGIRASCTTFCKSARYDGMYVLSWICDNGDEYHELYSSKEILESLNKIRIVFEAE